MKRGRLMMLTLLALVLPTAALASTEGFTVETGPLNFNASVSSTNFFLPLQISAMNPWILQLIGTDGDTITLNITSLMGCGVPNRNNCAFSGTVAASGPDVSGIFKDTIMGTLDRGANNGAASVLESLTATLGTSGGVAPDSNLSVMDVSICRAANNVCLGLANGRLLPPQGSASLDVDFVPEPSTLSMLGTGLISLAGLMGRKLKLGT